MCSIDLPVSLKVSFDVSPERKVDAIEGRIQSRLEIYFKVML
jgi:hypothetical protein